MKDFFARFRSRSSVTVNGRTYSGRTVEVNDGCVRVDGEVVADHATQPRIEVTLNGDVETLETAAGDVTVQGSAGSVTTKSGDVRCGAVAGYVTTTSGDVNCRSIAGPVSTVSGDIG